MKKTVAQITGETPAGLLDWEGMRQSGLWGVMIAAGTADYSGGVKFYDFAAPCIRGAEGCGLRVGLVIEGRCKTPFAAHSAARQAALFAEETGAALGLPTALALSERRLACLIEQGRDGLTDTALAFLFETRRAGGEAVISTDSAFAESYLDIGRLRENSLWISGPARRELGGLYMRGVAEGEEGYIPQLGGFLQNVIVE